MSSNLNPAGATRQDFIDLFTYLKEGGGLQAIVETLALNIAAIRADLAVHYVTESDFAALEARVAALEASIPDLISQIIYEGSANKMQFTSPTVTVTGSGVTAALSNGVLHIVKESSSLVGDNPVITITGVNVPAGQWYFGIPTKSLIPSIIAQLKDDQSADVAYTDETGVSERFFTSAFSGGSIVLTVSKTYATPSGGIDIIPYIAGTVLTGKTATPYFRPLVEVSENA